MSATMTSSGQAAGANTSTPTVEQLGRPVDWSKKKFDHTTVKGDVKNVRYRDPDTGFVVVELVGGQVITGEDIDLLVTPGQAYAFAGRWADNNKYGRQFKFDLVMHDVPAYRDSIVNYLVDNAPGIGTKRAEKLFDAFGADTIEVVRKEPGKVHDITGLSVQDARHAADHLEELLGSEHAKLDLYRLFSGHGFPRKLCAKVVRSYGRKAAEKVRRNPFALHTEFGMPLNRADRLWVELGHPPDALKRQALWAVQGSVGREGSTWVLRMQAEEEIYKKCGKDGENINVERAINVSIRAGFISCTKIGNAPYLALAKRARNERIVSDKILLLSSAAPAWPEIPDAAGVSEHQREQLGRALAGAVGLLMGSAGTGKTFTTACVVRELLKVHGSDQIAVCAPTGKAAVRITEAMRQNGVEIQATTIHKLLAMRPNDTGGDMQPDRNESKPIDHKFIIVDEVSMLDVDVFAALVAACQPGTHVLLVGDPYQLPPVGHGAPLRDLRDGGLPQGLLTEIRRNAGAIVEGCQRVKDGLLPKFPEKIDLAAGHNLRLIPNATAEDALNSLGGVIERLAKKHVESPKDEPHPIWGVQVLVGVNAKGQLSRHKINDFLQNLLNGNAAKLPGNPFRVGDKVICLKNGQYAVGEYSAEPKNFITDANDWGYIKADGEEVKASGSPVRNHYVANGEVGECIAIAPAASVLKFSNPERFVKVPIYRAKNDEEVDPSEDDKGRLGNFDLAYACTCHKYQGSEVPIAIVMLDEGAGFIAAREWHYTAISRARRLCLILGRPEILEKQIRRVTLRSRKTLLADMIRPTMIAKGFAVAEVSTVDGSVKATTTKKEKPSPTVKPSPASTVTVRVLTDEEINEI